MSCWPAASQPGFVPVPARQQTSCPTRCTPQAASCPGGTSRQGSLLAIGFGTFQKHWNVSTVWCLWNILELQTVLFALLGMIRVSRTLLSVLLFCLPEIPAPGHAYCARQAGRMVAKSCLGSFNHFCDSGNDSVFIRVRCNVFIQSTHWFF